MAKLEANYPGTRMRFRSRTSAEDLDGFSSNGIYPSESSDPMDSTRITDAVRTVGPACGAFGTTRSGNIAFATSALDVA